MTIDKILNDLKENGNPENLVGMARFGIDTTHAYGISIPFLKKYARQYKGYHELALQLWETGKHEARILASMVDDPAFVTEEQMDKWAHDFYSWDVCDQVCGNLFDRTPFAFKKAIEWSQAKEEFVRRAGFSMMAELAVHDKKATDSQFIPFFRCIENGCTDERNFVKKAVNWALRQMGKRNKVLYEIAISTSEKIIQLDSKSAKWIGKDALRELKEKREKLGW